MSPRWSLAATLLAAACGTPGSQTPWEWDLPLNFPEPEVPADNPVTVEKVALGRLLFHDTRLSDAGDTSCASCHQQALAWTDGRARALRPDGTEHPRGTMSLVNVAYATRLGRADPDLDSLEAHAHAHLFGGSPVDVGMAEDPAAVLDRLAEDPVLLDAFALAFPDEPELPSAEALVGGLASFQRALVSADSPYDRLRFGGDWDALDAQALDGMELFFSEELECFHCHGGPNFTDSFVHADAGGGDAAAPPDFHNTGLYNLDGAGAYPADNTGTFAVTGAAGDMGRHKAPSLRSISLTGPYMHDGSVADLDGVLDHYAAGGRTISSGEHAGDGSTSPLKSEYVAGFSLSDTERAELLAFLDSLADPALLTDPRFGDPASEQ